MRGPGHVGRGRGPSSRHRHRDDLRVRGAARERAGGVTDELDENAYRAERREPQLSRNGRLQLQGAWRATEGRELGREPVGINDHFAGRRGNLLLSGRRLASVRHATSVASRESTESSWRPPRQAFGARPVVVVEGWRHNHVAARAGVPAATGGRPGGWRRALELGRGGAARGEGIHHHCRRRFPDRPAKPEAC